uniref:Uncharacterized protein n=1 Tax=viral metagenome TaxID=1070528 RepID=A0A6C0JVS0_9ZZZZ
MLRVFLSCMGFSPQGLERITASAVMSFSPQGLERMQAFSLHELQSARTRAYASL